MTYEEFYEKSIEIMNKHDDNYYGARGSIDKNVKDQLISTGYFVEEDFKKTKYRYDHDFTMINTKPEKSLDFRYVELGGYSGGNCWGDDASPYSVDKHDDPDLLEVICEQLCPDIAFLKFRKAQKAIIKFEATISEYYGNSTTYEIHIFPLKQIYDILS